MNRLNSLFKAWTNGAGIPCGIAWHTPDQADFHRRVAGRWISDVVDGTHAPTSSITVAPNGCMDVTGLSQDGTFWLDLGGKAGVDFRAGRY